GLGVIDANGGSLNVGAPGGGGAIAIEYSDPTSVLPSLTAKSGNSGYSRYGGAGAQYVKGSSSIYGDLTVNNIGFVGQNTQLPALGNGVALNGSSGALLVTDRATDIPAYFA